MIQDAITKTILGRLIGGKGQGPFKWDTLVQCLCYTEHDVLATNIEVLQ